MEANAKALIDDSGLVVLELLLRLIGVGIEPGQLRRDLACPVDVKEMVRYSRKAGLAARYSKLTWKKLASGPLPAIATLRNGNYLLLGKVADDTAIVLAPHAERPVFMARGEFEAVWDGRLVSVKKRGAMAIQVDQFRGAATRRLQQFWTTFITRANDTTSRLQARLPTLIGPNAK